eukprot:UN27938
MDIMVSMILDIRSNTAKEQYFYTKCEYKNLKGVKCVAVIRRNHDMMRDLLQEDFEQMYNKSKKTMVKSSTYANLFSKKSVGPNSNKKVSFEDNELDEHIATIGTQNVLRFTTASYSTSNLLSSVPNSGQVLGTSVSGRNHSGTVFAATNSNSTLGSGTHSPKSDASSPQLVVISPQAS